MRNLILSLALIGTTLAAAPMASAQSTGFAVFGNNISGLMGSAPITYATPGNANYANGWRQWSQTYNNATDAFRTLCRWNWGGGHRGAVAPDATPAACAAVCNGNASCQ